ncbi:hypothetical protein EAO71_01920, partial [Streptomyces sp. ms191]
MEGAALSGSFAPGGGVVSERAGARVSLAEEHAAVLARLRATEDAAGAIGTSADERGVCRELAAFLHRHGVDAVAVAVQEGGQFPADT